MHPSILFNYPMSFEKILQAAIWQEGKDYVALCLNNNISSFGKNKKETLANLKEAVLLYEEDTDNQASDIKNLEITTLTI